MFKVFDNIQALEDHVEQDKRASGISAETLNRYPVRFVLLNNFKECDDFVKFLQDNCGVFAESVDKWIDLDNPDTLLTYREFANRIRELIKNNGTNDCALVPFSELARFYDNDKRKEFDALIKTIKGIESTGDSQRIYVPLVGLEGKMEAFRGDSQIVVWKLKGSEEAVNYRLVLTNGTDYGVKGLESHHRVVENINEWLKIWRTEKQQTTPVIICKSRSIYANAHYAQPDNAFSYERCDNAYDFLTRGLRLSFGGMHRLPTDGDNWEKLAQNIDVDHEFDFDHFVQAYFSGSSVGNYREFVRLWFEYKDTFDHWLLTRYYQSKQDGGDYLCRVLGDIANYNTSSLIETMAVTRADNDEEIATRKFCLDYGAKQGVALSNDATNKLENWLETIAGEEGYPHAIAYFTRLTSREKVVAISWLSKGLVTPDDLKGFYPDLVSYLSEGVGVVNTEQWVDGYFRAYKQAKIANKYTDDIRAQINELNEKESTFETWYNKFSTTYTLLSPRKDIEVFYWIDGLGVDWIPLVKKVIGERAGESIYLNEVLIARAKLPTKTSNNKEDLQRLLPDGMQLEKSGDLDELAHKKTNKAPYTIIDEIAIVRESLKNILDKYAGKKIAIISDHGMTYLSQLLPGLNLGGVQSDHNGRLGTRAAGNNTADNSYYRLEDGTTLCALKHESLCGKAPNSEGCHGGCTPEEALVPIFIISGSADAHQWEAELLTPSVSATEPKIRFNIQNISSAAMLQVEYNGKTYTLHPLGNDVYETDKVDLDAHATSVTLRVGTETKTWALAVNTGVEEADLFDF